MAATITKEIDKQNKVIYKIVNDGAASDDTDTLVSDVSTLYGAVIDIDMGAVPAAFAPQTIVTQQTSNATGTVLRISGNSLIVSLGNGSAAFTGTNVIDGFDASGGAINDTPTGTYVNNSRVSVLGLWWTVQGSNRVLLEWDADTDDRLISLGGNGKLNRGDMYVFTNPESTGVNGDVLVNWTSGANTGYTIILELEKTSGFEYPNTTY